MRHAQTREGQKERKRERERISSRLQLSVQESDMGLDPTNREITT